MECNLCNKKYKLPQSLYKHQRVKHYFNNWKLDIEDKHKCMFVKQTSEQKINSNSCKTYYVYHRAFFARQVANPKRTPKNSGSNKIGRACPASITLTKVESTAGPKFKVHFFPMHVGHQLEIGRLLLKKCDRNMIAGKLSEGVSFQRVLDDARNSALSDSSDVNVKRLHLLEQKDLHNIKRDYGINHSMKLHDNDAISVMLWVTKMSKYEDNPVLYYKDDDFILIIMSHYQEEKFLEFGKSNVCVDGTHGLNSYNFQLFTILIIDNYGSGMPVAFCFSNREDTLLFVHYFNCIKNKKKELIFNTLKVLQTEIDLTKFSAGLENMVRDLENDPDTSEFGQYLVNTYVARAEKWAYCFRQYLGINTNMYLEALHKKTKYTYLEGKKCQRLDKSVHALFNLMRDIYFESRIKVYELPSELTINQKLTAKYEDKLIITSNTKKGPIICFRDSGPKILRGILL
ncbi:hypothetical protein RI129_002962 [Pyrocoelia pectoralis]|uniref:C2H2-type domain-containing protein n=1 Tax=Pyrocoelia pectoralis TaxID=417401 RepID=A0AAN7VG71_9COLE